MALRFSVLASGSRGNATLVRSAGVGVLIDVGLGPRALAGRLESVGASWDRIAGVLLTHTHGDHVGDLALGVMARLGIVLYCHEGHQPELARLAGFQDLERKRLVRTYDDRPFLAPTGLRVEPLALYHDGGPTFGFRIEGRGERRSRPAAIGYLADTGCWSEEAAEALADVDLLGVEFNHDEELQRRSGRSWPLIRRILGDRGHLSNAQGAALVSAVLGRSRRGAVRHLVLLHLSQQCNRPELALGLAREAVRRAGRRATIHAALQDAAHPDVEVRPGRRHAGAVPGFPWEAA
ncbi:MAG: MBL fold metallo-hydrolase [Isosphaeraceae bacterium]|nr:MBL fold metallo-hydrolase [Isosphaeraceae bacterium]